MQKIIIVNGFWDLSENGDWTDSADEVNDLLADGWQVKNMIPMGSASYGYGSSSDSEFAEGHDFISGSSHFHGFASLLLLKK